MCLSLHIHSCWQAFVVPASNLPCTLTLSPNPQACTIDAANNFRSATSGRHGVDELHQQSASVPACLSTQVFDTADCEPKNRKAAAQSIRTGTACRLTMSRTLVCMLTTADDSSAHWNTRLFQWNTRANLSVPDHIVTQRPASHNAHIVSVI